MHTAFFNLSIDSVLSGRLLCNRRISEEMQYDKDNLSTMSSSLHQILNRDQMAIYDQVMATMTHSFGKFCFVSGLSGTSNTFLLNAITTALRAGNHIVLAVTSFGVAYLLLPGGRPLIRGSEYLLK
jgi:hypothetical protein